MTKVKHAGAKSLDAYKNLIQLETDSVAVKQANDINSKLNTLESSLGKLQTELETVNKSVEVGMECLTDSDLDLTAKVSETYKRLGDIDTTYQSLSAISDDIDSEVKKLTVEIADVAEQSTMDLANLEVLSSGKYSQLSEQHDQLIERINNLVKNSQDTHAQLNKSIEKNTTSLLNLKKQLIGEIDVLTNATQERDDELNAKLSKAEKNIATNKANIIKMQAVDSALNKRASELEKTTTALIKKSVAHQDALQQLDNRTEELDTAVRQLRVKTSKHEEQIIDIQVSAAIMGRNIVALANTVKKHFWISSGMFATIALIIAGISYYQNTINSSDVQQFAGVQGELETINQKLHTVDDQLNSVDGRLSYISPFSQFGKDNTIHGPQWLATQSADRYAIQVASTASKEELYTIAQRYSYYFKENLSYYTFNTTQGQRYVLVYGNFASNNEAASVMWNMPQQINFQRPIISRIGDIQKFI
ncbi:MAG: SPOR domain-containing protein [Sulfuriflexus sp.]|nr:SPOR domain-containing protein [Sulfuriflexus sp.]